MDQLTLSPHRQRERPSRRTRAHSAFHRLREQNLPVHPAGACATYLPRNHGLHGRGTRSDQHRGWSPLDIARITVAPVALRIKVAEVEARLLAEADVCDGTGNLARHEGAATTGTLVVEEDAIACVHVVRLAIILCDPKCIQLCDAVRAARIEGRVLVLRDSLHEPVKLGGRRLIEPHVVLEATGADGIEQTQGTERVDVARILCHVKGDFDVRLRAEIINLRRLDLRDDVDKVGAIRQVSVV